MVLSPEMRYPILTGEQKIYLHLEYSINIFISESDIPCESFHDPCYCKVLYIFLGIYCSVCITFICVYIILKVFKLHFPKYRTSIVVYAVFSIYSVKLLGSFDKYFQYHLCLFISVVGCYSCIFKIPKIDTNVD